jgi:hypothetical protein
MRQMLFTVPASLALSLGCGAFAQSFDFSINQEASSTDLNLSVSVPFSGSLIGNYDAAKNPEGTQTRLGFFGGSGNQAISYSAAFGLAGGNQTVPTGDFSLDVDHPAGNAVMSGLMLDILGGQPEQLDATITINYDTFRSIDPNSLYIGGFDIPIPLGSVDLLLMNLTQTADATLVLTVDADGVTSLTGVVTGELAVQVVVLEQDLGILTMPAIFPIQASLVENENGAEMLLQSSLDLAQAIPAADTPFENLAFELPTIVPPGEFASVLVSGNTDEGTISGLFSLVMIADADNPVCSEDPDLNGDGVVDGIDLTILLGDWSAPGGPADINCDDIVNGFDLSLLLAFWTI